MDDVLILSVTIIGFIYCFIFALGSAKLSYKYNSNNGSSSGFLWSILAFFFSSFYYPFYALVLDRD